MVGTTLDQLRPSRMIDELLGEEIKLQHRDTEVFYSVKDPRETCINEDQFLSPGEILEDENHNISENKDKLTDEKAKEQKEKKVKFENSLEKVISSR
jgi:hypothetical protein